MAEGPHLRVIDGNGQLDEDSAVIPKDLALLEEECRRLRRQVSSLKGQLSRLRKVDPAAETVASILAYWRARCHGPDSRHLIPLDGKRADAVRKALRWLVEADEDPALADPDKDRHAAAMAEATQRAADRIKGAIDGAAAFPYEGRYGVRYGEAADGLKHKVDVNYILRDEPKIAMFEALHEGDTRRRAYAAELHKRLVASERLRQVLATFDPEMGEILARAIRWCQSCDTS